MYAITHISVFDGSTIAEDQAIFIDRDTISAVMPMSQAKSRQLLPTDCLDGTGLLATAGFIDIQLNGCGGVLLNTDIAKSTLDTMNATNLRYGTTQYLPTFITSEAEPLNAVIQLIESIDTPESEGVLGLHLEGPFINRQKKGAHQEQCIRDLDEETAEYLIRHAHCIKVITLAPESCEQSVINQLTEANIIVSMGHTNGRYTDYTAKHGISMATHLFNAMSPLDSREPGAVGYIFDRKPHAGIIVDGIHVNYASIRIAHQLLGEKLFMVTDAVTPAGTDLKEYDMAGTKAYVTDGKCHYADGTIAGAAITMIEGVHNLINHVGVSKEEALRMASLYPAKALGLDAHYGRVRTGYKANLALLTADLQVKGTVQMGLRHHV
ncbi:N-acetylglucosamine-6-phosphate deacetylase [Photobacterium sp. WH77]|uniref:N-acetylglucosamine-6-phosphate deacetylase n=1 Tax=unclassified Photobacterium TaxID=2628852 RepID=UPI001EDAB82F|nr:MULTISPECIES: N-acetylglucosamine-6-phosphate deacetylase [unclassified Photobacterium]MCG2838448.1 N-acetylglucosamine-6-phosphate deacetylase [Photobacterium sp. WH77]MCG2846065.1 N-acetylglucosamine-6-phosphate deacetylase [Photobacterium sp. WH80]MDO6582121.1 N-acetylglucosamine-6-phosphate deacetylase [Photobacterium sp. 2_MG-2023]